MLGLHTRGQQSTDNGLQNAYMTTLFGSFGAKSLYNGGKLVYNIYGNPNSPSADKFIQSLLPIFVYFNGILFVYLCPNTGINIPESYLELWIHKMIAKVP
jgi:hypothetical protein